MIRILVIVFISIFITISTPAYAIWVWTPETNKWVNPKYAVKDTPQEQLEYALSFYKSKQYKEAIREFRKLLKHYPRAREAPSAQFYLAVISEERDSLMKAFKDYQLVIDKYPFSERANEIVQRQYGLGMKLMEGRTKEGMLKGMFTDDYGVVEIFRQVIKNAPYGKLAPTAQYKIGLYLQEKGLFQEARDEFEKVINDYPESEWTKAAKYQIALSDAQRSTDAQYDQRVTEEAVAAFKEFVEVYPDADLSKDAKVQISQLREKEAENNFVIAQFYEKQKRYDAAKVYYKAVVDDFSDSTWAKQALQRIQELTSLE